MAYAECMVLMASADGTLVREELAVIESCMGMAMIHPEGRIIIRQLLESPPKLEDVLNRMSKSVLKYAIRDAAAVAASDGEYGEEELAILRQMAEMAEMSTEELGAIFSWVDQLWALHEDGNKIMN